MSASRRFARVVAWSHPPCLDRRHRSSGREVTPMTAPAGQQPGTTSPFSMPLEEAMRTQRAIRRLKPDPVDDALVLQLIELALKAPTGSNAQNWEFVVVRDPAVKAKLARFNRQAWSLY